MATKEFCPIEGIVIGEWIGRRVTLRQNPLSKQQVKGTLRGVIFEARTKRGVILTLIIGDRLAQVFGWMAEIRMERQRQY